MPSEMAGLHDNHSTGYSMIGFLCAMLRYYHPVEFVAAYLNNAGDESDIIAGTELAVQRNIKILPPRFRHATGKYNPDAKNKTISKGIGSIKYASDKDGENLYALRDKKYDTFCDFLADNPCDSRTTKILTMLDFFEEFGGSKKLLQVIDIFEQYNGGSIIKKQNCDLPSSVMLQFATETAKQYRMVDMQGFIAYLCSKIPDESISLKEKIDAECEYLGYIDVVLPNAKQYGYVTDIDTKYSPRVTLHSLETGRKMVCKVSKKTYEGKPFNKGDILQYVTQSKPKMRMVDGQWTALPEKEIWITNYLIRDFL